MNFSIKFFLDSLPTVGPYDRRPIYFRSAVRMPTICEQGWAEEERSMPPRAISIQSFTYNTFVRHEFPLEFFFWSNLLLIISVVINVLIFFINGLINFRSSLIFDTFSLFFQNIYILYECFYILYWIFFKGSKLMFIIFFSKPANAFLLILPISHEIFSNSFWSPLSFERLQWREYFFEYRMVLTSTRDQVIITHSVIPDRTGKNPITDVNQK